MTYEALLDKWVRKLGRPCTAGEIVHDLRQLEQPVRCKDCKNYVWHDHRCVKTNHGFRDDFFCAWGERREEG